MRTMHATPHLTDALIGFTASTVTGAAVVQHDPSANPWITQILVPLVVGVLVPFLKELSAHWLTKQKERKQSKKK